LDLNAVERVETAFSALAAGVVTMPPILRLDIPEFRGEVDVKTAYVPGLDGFVIKISPGFFDNPKIGLPSTNGMMVLLDARTGLIQALLLDNGYLTNVRTAAAGAVAARYLARPEAQVAAVLGAGVQARLQLPGSGHAITHRLKHWPANFVRSLGLMCVRSGMQRQPCEMWM
jgi:ornithine cyclodeaminase